MGDIKILIDLKDDSSQIRGLWELIFSEDTSDYLDFYFDHVYKNNIVIVARENENIIGMLHMNPYELKENKTYYIVGVATLPEFRGKGIMRKMMEFAIEIAKAEHISKLILLPVDERYYAPFGFRFVSNQYNTLLHSSLYHQHVIESDMPIAHSIQSFHEFNDAMIELKKMQGGIESYKEMEVLWTDQYIEQLYDEMKSEGGKISSVDEHIVLFYDEEIVEVRTIYINPHKSLDGLKKWLILYAKGRDIHLHEVNERVLSQYFSYHQSNIYDFRPYMMILSTSGAETSVNGVEHQEACYFNEVV